MSPWDRQATIRRYERRFDAAEDELALIDRLGTPTAVAVELARDYVASPPPDGLPEIVEAEDEGEQLSLDQLVMETEPQDEAGTPESAPAGGAARTVYWVFAVLIGLPVALALLVVGVPFAYSGIWLIDAVLRTVPRLLGAFNLVSDVLLLAGAGAAGLAAGILLTWLGIWLSVSLCKGWIIHVILALDKRLRKGKGAA